MKGSKGVDEMPTGIDDLRVLEDASHLSDQVWDEIQRWKPFDRDVVGKQLARAIDSIGANIAEEILPDEVRFERNQPRRAILEMLRKKTDTHGRMPYFSKKDFEKLEPFMERLDRFLDDLPKQYKYGVEIRNRNWLNESFADLCRKHDVALVLVDQAWMPHGDEVAKRFDPVTADFSYIRLLGDRKEIESITKKWDREVIDRQERLQRWAKLLADLDHSGVRTYVYVNNHIISLI